MPKPGLIFVTSKILDPEQTSEEQHDRFYYEEHLQDITDFMKNKDFPVLALRYQNTNPERSRDYLALYPNPDAEKTFKSVQQIFFEGPRESKVLGGSVFEYLAVELLPYEKIQTFEGYGHAEKDGTERGQTIVCVAMEPAATVEQEQDFEDWYRKQHLDMLSMCKGYRRTTRYKRLDDEKPRYLALHEYACKPEDLPKDQIQQVTATEWTQKILAEAETFERDVFELIDVHGDSSVKL